MCQTILGVLYIFTVTWMILIMSTQLLYFADSLIKAD